jgi:hypothetical protein
MDDDDVGEERWDVDRSAAGEVEVERWVPGGRGRLVGGQRRPWGEVSPCFWVLCVGGVLG